MSEVPAPVAEHRRIKSLDVVRGLAVLGILAVNALYFDMPWGSVLNPLLPPIAITEETLWTWLVMHVFFELKMVTLFSILFGASIYLVGGETDDAPRGLVLRRRLAWLLVFGVAHGALIWAGDILFTYALAGFIVMFARSWTPRRLLLNGLIVFAIVVILPAVLGSVLPLSVGDLRAQAALWAPTHDELMRTVEGYQNNSFATNFGAWTWLTFGPHTIVFIVRTISMMLIGMALFKWGFFSGNLPKWLFALMIAAAAASLALVGWQAHVNVAARFDVEHMVRFGQAANNILSPLVSLGYASLLILVVKLGVLRFITNALAAVGRMAFTNYLTQSLIMTTIFYGGRGLGLYGEVDRVSLWGVVIAVWLLQLIWSPLWLSRFQMGPFEWVWRRLSYARPVAMAK